MRYKLFLFFYISGFIFLYFFAHYAQTYIDMLDV